MKKKEKTIGIGHYIKLRFILLGICLLISIIFLVIFGCFYFLKYKENIILILFISSILFSILTLTALIYISYDINKVFYKELLLKTKGNYELIENNDYSLIPYSTKNIHEINQLNSSIETINDNFKNLIITTKDISYKDLNFEYSLNYDAYVITKESFVNNIFNLISLAKTFRNAFLSFSYDAKEDEVIEKKDKSALLRLIIEQFKENNIIIASDTDTSFLVFIPNIDSLSILKEKLEYISKNALIAHYEGLNEVIKLIISCVIYPYSDYESIMSDLRYAERKGELINFYIPQRQLNKIKDIYTDSQKVNMMNKIIQTLNGLAKKKLKSSAYVNEIGNSIKSISEFLKFESSGVIIKDIKNSCFRIVQSYSVNEDNILKVGDIVDNDFVTYVNEYSDIDGSYTFFKRENVNLNIGHYLDIYGIQSGYIYLIYHDTELYGFVYYVNYSKDLILDNYSRESLLLFSNLLGSIYKEFESKSNLITCERNLENLLILSNYKSYTISKDDFKLTALSSSLKDVKRKAKEGMFCYKALYNLESPCKDCPLIKNRKKIVEIDKEHYYINISNTRDDKNRVTIFLEPKSKEDVSRLRYDPFLLINTDYSLMDHLIDVFNFNSKGYFLLLRIENYNEYLGHYKEEGIRSALSSAIKIMQDENIGDGNIYLYKNNSLGFILNEYGRNELFPIVERIEEIFSFLYKDDELKMPLTFTMFAFQYPLSYPTAYDLIRNIETILKNNKPNNNNMLVFPDSNVTRSASRNTYILALLNEAFANKTFDIRILPFINKKTNGVIGGEILLRLKDDLTNYFFYASEFIAVASRNQKMNEFSNLLIEQIGKLYQQYGSNVFRTNSLNRISVNIDTTYFNSASFLDDIAKLIKIYKFQKDFLSFEINEADISQHMDVMKTVCKRLRSYDILLSCDQYSGKEVSLDNLAKLNFNEIKISREIVKDIDNNPLKLNEVKMISSEAQALGIKVCLVGIERREQHNIINDNEDIDVVQGFYYYKPLELDEFLTTIRSGGKKDYGSN